MSSKHSSKSTRRIDAESGMNRVSFRSKPKKAEPPPSSSDDEFLSSDSELEQELDIPAKDDSRLSRKAPPAPARKGKKDGRSRDFKGEEDDHAALDQSKAAITGKAIAPHRQILLAGTYHHGLSSVSRASVSSFVPSSVNYFMMVNAICGILVENTLLHEMCPSFFTPAMFLYFGHVYFYQILRARQAAGTDVLTRLEKRSLTYYERVGTPDAWPIPAPLLGFLEYFGSHKTEDPYFGWIVPALPNFSPLNANSLRSLNAVAGVTRIPIIPALQQLLHNFGSGNIVWNDDILYPVDPTLSITNLFVGLNSSTATSAPFQALAFSAAWLMPNETNNNIGPYDLLTKANRIRRWAVPPVGNEEDLSSLSSFLGFKDDSSFSWMKNLLSTAEICCRFFPGSGTLGSVSPLTTLGAFTRVEYSTTTPRVSADHKWFHSHDNWKSSYRGYSNTDAGLLDTKMALTVSPNSAYTTWIIPALCGDSSPLMKGPFFLDAPVPNANFEYMCVPITEGTSTQDPCSTYQQLASRLYDNKAGR